MTTEPERPEPLAEEPLTVPEALDRIKTAGLRPWKTMVGNYLQKVVDTIDGALSGLERTDKKDK